MPLKLTIISFQRLSPSQEKTRILEHDSISIGRASQNEWILEDPERILSSKHCKVYYQEGHYFLTDISTNGTFLNDSEQRIPRNQTIQLASGDRFTLGEYEISVTVMPDDVAIDTLMNDDGPVTAIVTTPDIPNLASDIAILDKMSPDDRSSGNVSRPSFADIMSEDRSQLGSGSVVNKPPAGTAATEPPADILSPDRASFAPPDLISERPSAQPDPFPPQPRPLTSAPDLRIVPQKPKVPEIPDDLPEEPPVVQPVLPIPDAKPPTASPAIESISRVIPKTPRPSESTPEPVPEKPIPEPASETLIPDDWWAQPPAAPETTPPAPPIPLPPAFEEPPAPVAAPPTPEPPAPPIPLPPAFEEPPAPVAAPPAPEPPIPLPPAFEEPPAPVAAPPTPEPPAPKPRPKLPVAELNAALPKPPVYALDSGSTDVDANVEALLEAFRNGAGLPLMRWNEKQKLEALANLGTILRETVQGLMEILMARSDIKGEFRLDRTEIGPIENNPLKTPPGRPPLRLEEVMALLLIGQGDAYMPAQQAVRESFEDIKAHQLAVMQGIQVALAQLTRRLDPKALESRLQQEGTFDRLFSSHKARCWDLFVTEYQAMVQEAEDDFSKLFGDEFASAYEKMLRDD